MKIRLSTEMDNIGPPSSGTSTPKKRSAFLQTKFILDLVRKWTISSHFIRSIPHKGYHFWMITMLIKCEWRIRLSSYLALLLPTLDLVWRWDRLAYSFWYLPHKKGSILNTHNPNIIQNVHLFFFIFSILIFIPTLDLVWTCDISDHWSKWGIIYLS